MRTRRARAADAAAIHSLIAHYAAQGLLLEREEAEIRRHARHFLVLEAAGEISGCVSIEPYGANLAEIRSLAVAPEFQGRGLGGGLLEAALGEARRRGIARVFAVTHVPQFFVGHRFAASSRRLREKIARDCDHCPKAATCRLVTVVAEVIQAPAALRILEPAAQPLTAL